VNARVFAVWTSLATILTLNAVIVLGLLGAGETRLFGGMLTVLHVVLPISSVLMLALLVKGRHWTGAAIFAVIVTGMLVVVTLRMSGQHLSPGLHLATDVAALNGYLIVVPWYRTRLARRG
jgi:hypothetical protein